MKKILIFILIALGIISLTHIGIIVSKYITNKDIIGEYELVDSPYGAEDKLKIKLYKWTKGDKKDLKCDLWNCFGYDYGTYEIKDNKITVYLKSTNLLNSNSSGTMYYSYEIVKEDNDTYLYLDDGEITKYKRIK